MLEFGTCLREMCVAGSGNSFISWYGLEWALKPPYIEKIRWASSTCKEPAQEHTAIGKCDCIKALWKSHYVTKTCLLNIMQMDLKIALCTFEIILYYFQSPRKFSHTKGEVGFLVKCHTTHKARSMSLTPEMWSHKKIPSLCIAKENKIRFTMGTVAVNLKREMSFIYSKWKT